MWNSQICARQNGRQFNVLDFGHVVRACTELKLKPVMRALPDRFQISKK